MSKHTVDVIMPTYNGARWISQAVQSVLGQTHKELKLYIVDDGSTDDTAKYAKGLSDERVTYIYQDNAGAAYARNTGIKASNSEFVAFLDADDFWTPDKLEKQLAVMDKDPEVGLVYGHHYIEDEDGIIQRNLRIYKRGYIADELAGGNFIAGSASMALVRRSVLDKIGLFREDFVNGEDWEMWLRIAMQSKVDFVPEILATIRQHPENSQNNLQKMADGLVYAYSVMKRELPLTPLQRKRVASYCLYHAADMEMAMGKRWKAKKILAYLFTQNTRAFFEMENWKVNISYGLFPRVLIGNPVFDLLWRVVRKSLKILRAAVRFCFRAACYVIRSVFGKPKQ